MKKKSQPSAASAFDIALQKGDYQLPAELPKPDQFTDFLESFVTTWEWLGNPSDKTMYHLGIWKTYDPKTRRKQFAQRFNKTPSAVSHWINDMQKLFERNKAAAQGKRLPPTAKDIPADLDDDSL